jgi:16S rRNA (uracil1498-N3)-methyltransferase
MLPRFYAPSAAPGEAIVDLPPDEARHLSRVLRLRAGARIGVFDGRGREFLAEVESVSRDGARVRLLGPGEPAPEPSVRLTLVQGVLKGEHMDAVVRDAVMMGVAAIQPVATAHGQVRLDALARGAGAARWRRIAVASAKQCRRAVVPDILPPREFAALAADASADLRVLLVEPAAAGAGDASALRALPRPRAADLAIGPEGGWAAEEIETAVAHGFVPVTLGARTLRADAVPVAAIAVLQFLWEL